MVQPINYALDVLSPIQGALRGYQLGREDIGQRQVMQEREQMMGFRAAQEQRAQQQFAMQQAQAAQARAAAERGQSALLALHDQLAAGTATSSDVRRAILENPGMAQQFQALSQSFTAERLGNEQRFGQQLSFALAKGNTDFAQKMLEERRDAAIAAGDQQSADAYEANILLLAQDPNSVLTGTLAPLAATMEPDDFDKFYKTLGLGGTEMRVQSSINVGPGISVQTMTDGTTRVVDTTTNEPLTGETARQAIEAAQAQIAAQRGAVEEAAGAGRLGARVELGAAAAGAEAAGRTAIEIGREAFGRVGAIREQAGRLNEVVRLIDEGATTGVIAERLPDWNASTIELRNLQRELGLDVVGSVTFGALSESELALALQTGLPTQLSGPDLRNWAVRKKAAQDKLADYLERQAIFLSTPGNTLDMWLRQVQQERAAAPAAAPAGVTRDQFMSDPRVMALPEAAREQAWQKYQELTGGGE